MLRCGYFCNEKLAWSGAVLGATPVTLRWGAVAGGLPEGCGAGTAGGCGEDSPCPLVPHSARQGLWAAAAEAPLGVRAPRLWSPLL